MFINREYGLRSVGRLIEDVLEENVGRDIYWVPECHQNPE
jgi:hypothetical protein